MNKLPLTKKQIIDLFKKQNKIITSSELIDLKSAEGRFLSIDLNSKINFHHVVNLKAKVIQIRSIKKNDTVGYGATFKAKKNMYIGTIAVGYADGFDRKFSNNMKVYFRNKPLKVLGRVSMDLMTIDLTPIYTAKKYNKVMYIDVINKFNNINILSARINTIPYEILTSLGNRYKRKYI